MKLSERRKRPSKEQKCCEVVREGEEKKVERDAMRG